MVADIAHSRQHHISLWQRDSIICALTSAGVEGAVKQRRNGDAPHLSGKVPVLCMVGHRRCAGRRV